MRAMRYDSGPDCAVCGMKTLNVVHDDPMTRVRNVETWAAPSHSMNGLDYYTWSEVDYHPFRARTTQVVQGEYERGYQAGYHAGIRRRELVR